jgi:hypothetical protein
MPVEVKLQLCDHRNGSFALFPLWLAYLVSPHGLLHFGSVTVVVLPKKSTDFTLAGTREHCHRDDRRGRAYYLRDRTYLLRESEFTTLENSSAGDCPGSSAIRPPYEVPRAGAISSVYSIAIFCDAANLRSPSLYSRGSPYTSPICGRSWPSV